MKEENYKEVQSIISRLDSLRKEISDLQCNMTIRIKVAIPQRDSQYHPLMNISNEMQNIIRTIAIDSRESEILTLTKELEAL